MTAGHQPEMVAAAGPPDPGSAPPTAVIKAARRLAPPILFVAVVGLVPAVFGGTGVDIGTLVLIATVGAVALNMLQGIAGQLSVGNAAFMAVGAFAAGSLASAAQVPFPFVLVVAAAAGLVFGVLVGIPALRVRGLYLLIATLAFQYVINYAFNDYLGVTGKAAGLELPIPALGSLSLESSTAWYVTWAVLAGLAVWVMSNALRSRLGRAWMAIRTDERLAAAMGVNVSQGIVVIFGISSAIIAVQGAMFAYFVGLVQANTFSLDLAVGYLAMVIIGGEGSVVGPILGAVVVEAIPYTLNSLANSSPVIAQHSVDVQDLLYGLLIIVVLTTEQAGLAGLGRRVWVSGTRAYAKARNRADGARAAR